MRPPKCRGVGADANLRHLTEGGHFCSPMLTLRQTMEINVLKNEGKQERSPGNRTSRITRGALSA